MFECGLQWWEWTNDRVASLPGAENNKWTDLYPTNKTSPTLIEFYKWTIRPNRDQDCPGMPKTIPLPDKPTRGLYQLAGYDPGRKRWVTTGPLSFNRDLYIYVRVTNDARCNCRFPNGLFVRVYQHIEADHGVPVRSELTFPKAFPTAVGDPPGVAGTTLVP